MLKDQLQQDLKVALLAGDKMVAEVLRGLKSAILYEEVAKGARETGLSEEASLAVLAREAKKRAESAEIYSTAGAPERANAELKEKAVIDKYLPTQLSDEQLAEKVHAAIEELGEQAQMGQVISAVKRNVGQSADGGRIAAVVKMVLHR